MRTHNRTHTHTHAQTHGHLQLLSRNPSTIREADFFSKEASDISAPEREGVAAHSASSALESQTDKLNIPGDDMLASLAQLMCKHACLVAQPPGGLNNCWKKEQQGHHHGQTCVLT
eukprot:scaffold31256_cov22-Tisochrysis_lutea.AAC.1